MVLFNYPGNDPVLNVKALIKAIQEKKNISLQKLALRIRRKHLEYTEQEILAVLKGFPSSEDLNSIVFYELQSFSSKTKIDKMHTCLDISSKHLTAILNRKKTSLQYLSGGVVPQ